MSLGNQPVWNLSEVQEILRNDAKAEQQSQIQKDKEELERLRKEILSEMQENTQIDKNLKDLDETIRLYIKQNMSVHEIVARSQRLIVEHKVPDGNVLGASKKLYEQMFLLLQLEPHYIASLAYSISIPEFVAFIQIVTGTIYGDQYDARLERLFLLLLDLLLAFELELCTEKHTFLRANTPTTKFLSSYCRREQSIYFLREILHDDVAALAADPSIDFELRPEKIYAELLREQELNGNHTSEYSKTATQDVMENHPTIKRIQADRATVLESYVTKIFNNILKSAQNIPFGIRWLMLRIRERCLAKWPNSSADEINSLLGGFIFLRYISPAITAPDSYKIIDESIGACRRNCVLIAKVIQNMSNGTFFRENYMQSLNNFIQTGSAQLSAFFAELCDVEPLNEHMLLEIECSLERDEYLISTTLNDVYQIHAYLYEHKKRIFHDPKDPLNGVLEKLGEPPTKLRREEDLSVNLHLGKSDHVSSYEIKKAVFDDSVFVNLKTQLANLVLQCNSFPSSATNITSSTIPTLIAIQSEATFPRNLIPVVKEIITILQTLVSNKRFLSAEIAYASAVRDLGRKSDIHNKIKRKLKSATQALNEIQSTRKEMLEKLELQKTYLNNIQNQGKVTVKLPNKEFTHKELEDKKVITESRLPADVRKKVKFVFSTNDCCTFHVAAKYRSVPVFSIDFELSELLTKHANQENDFFVDDLTLNVDMLINLFNTHFIAKGEQMKKTQKS
eukprot:c16257_g1_i1.p1 GENE.c16257_g1_i1~~c16257_g1_i1.p1  ORF type:complete len:735 (-),score=290.96 c16257_g1_i1:15-2219(-)